MSRALTRSVRGFRLNTSTILLGLIVIGLIIWFMRRNKVAQYNAEKVTIQRDERGRIQGLTVNRSAH